jgi:actin-related protein 8
LQSDGRRRYATAPQQIAAFNRRSNPEFFDDNSMRCFKSDEETIIGDDVLSLDPSDNYNIHFPMKRGELNLHSGVGGSITSVINDLQEIWEYVLQNHLQVDLR